MENLSRVTGNERNTVLQVQTSDKANYGNDVVGVARYDTEFKSLKSRFIEMASHEFRTPLCEALSSAYLVSKYNREGQQEQREKHLEKIISSVNSLTELLDEFLSVDKLKEGKVSANFVYFDVKHKISKMIQDLNNYCNLKMDITYDHIGDENKVILDPVLLKGAMLHLLSNAIKFSNNDHPITITTRLTERHFEVSVKNWGVGIPLSEQPNVFRLFYRSVNAEKVPGIGMGLYTAKKYVELMGGIIGFTCEPGKETEFTMGFNIITSSLN